MRLLLNKILYYKSISVIQARVDILCRMKVGIRLG